MVTSTAPVAWRAISPVSRVTVLVPHVKVFFAISNTLVPRFCPRGRHGGAVRSHWSAGPKQKARKRGLRALRADSSTRYGIHQLRSPRRWISALYASRSFDFG